MRRRLKAVPDPTPEVTFPTDEPPAVWVETRTLIPWLKNPRKNDPAVASVMRSIKRFGWGAPIVARKANSEIIAGHTRVKAALQLGLPRVPVRFVDLSAKEAHELAIADNKLGELATWDDSLLLEAMREEKLALDDLLDMGFSDRDAKKYVAFLANEGGGAEETDEDEIPPKPASPVTKVGDVWELGRHRLVCGDCRDQATVERFFDGVKATVAFTSPPYASQRKYDEESDFKPIHPDDFVEWFYAVQANVERILAPDGSWFVNIKEHADDGQRSLYVKDLTIAHVRQWRWMFVDEFCWRNTKNGTPGGFNNRFKNAFEPVFHFAKAGTPIKFRPDNVNTLSDGAFSTVNTKTTTGSGLLGPHQPGSGFARPSNVVECASATEQLHSAAFPVALPEFFIKAFTDPDDIVFDPFMGSGTTMVACEKLNRIAYGTEISPAYCDMIVARWEKLTGQKAKRIKRTKPKP